MRTASLVLLMTGCFMGDKPAMVVTEPGIVGEGEGFCLAADPSTVVFDGAVAPDERQPVWVTLSTPESCIEPFTVVDTLQLDDPAGAFAVVGLAEPLELQPGVTGEVELSFTATEPGVYEGQLIVSGSGAFGEGSSAVQLYVEIP